MEVGAMDRFYLYEQIEKGKYHEVFKGRRKQSIDYYGVKGVKKSQKARVLQEVRMFNVLPAHDRVIRLYEWHETTNHMWMVFEYCVGGSLMELIRQDLKLPEKCVRNFGRDALAGLHHLHAHGIIYGDLKPSNLLLDDNGRLKLSSLGLSRRLADINRTPVGDLPKDRRGTPCYMSPELFNSGGCGLSAGVHSFQSDMWALGCVLYESAVGRPPFVSSSFAELVMMIANDEPEYLGARARAGEGTTTTFSRDFLALLSGLLEKDAGVRMSWPEVMTHPFWRRADANGTPPTCARMPVQAAFNEFVSSSSLRGAAATHRKAAVGATMGSNGGMSHALANEENRDPQKQSTNGDSGGRLAHAAVSPRRDGGRGGGAGTGQDTSSSSSSSSRAHADVVRLSRAARLNLEDEDESTATGYGSRAARSPILDDGGGGVGGGGVGRGVDSSSSSSTSAVPMKDNNDIRLNHPDNELDFSDTSHRSAGTAFAHVDGSDDEPMRPALAWSEGDSHDEPRGRNGSGGHTNDDRSSSPGHETRIVDDEGMSSAFVEETEDMYYGDAMITASQELESALSCIGKLAWHASDSAVKPIAQNKRIERQQGPEYDAKQISFKPIPLHEMLELDQEEMENLLTMIYQCLAGNSTVNEKISVLSYFETLCVDANAANMFVNSSIMSMLVSLMRASKAALIRTRVAAVIGVLVRHATYISEDLVHTKIVQVLADAMKDSSERVRRKSAAAFGELLFYISTQQQDAATRDAVADAAASVWTVSATNIGTMCRLLRPGEDEIAMHYVVKTIENIATLGGVWTDRFATTENAQNLMNVFQASGTGSNETRHTGNSVVSRSENFRGTVASTLARLCRASDKVLEYVAERGGSRLLLSGMRDKNAKVQQSFLGIALTILIEQSKSASTGRHWGSRAGARSLRLFAREERGTLAALEALLSVPSSIVKGKALLCCSMLLSQYPRWLLRLFESKYIQHIDRGMREGAGDDKYLHECASAAQRILVQILPGLLDQIRTEVDKKAERAASSDTSRRRPQSSSYAHNHHSGAASGAGKHELNGAKTDGGPKKEPASLVPILVHIVTSPTLLEMIASDNLMDLMSDILRRISALSTAPSFKQVKTEMTTVLRAVEAISHKRHLLVEHYDTVLDLVDTLLSLACGRNTGRDGSRSQPRTTADYDQEITVLSMKLTSDILMAILREPASAASSSPGDNGDWSNTESNTKPRSSDCSIAVDRFLRARLLPSMPVLMEGEEPVPVYALKLLDVVLGSRVELAAEAVRAGLLPKLAEFMSLQHPNNNVHNVWACSAIVGHDNLVRSGELLDLRIPEKVVAIINYSFQNSVDAFFEPSIHIMHTLLRRVSRKPNAALRDELLLLIVQNFNTFVSLTVVGDDDALGDEVASCLLLALDLGGRGRANRICAGIVNSSTVSHLCSEMRQTNAKRVFSVLLKACASLSGAAEDVVDVNALASRDCLPSIRQRLNDLSSRTDAGADSAAFAADVLRLCITITNSAS